VGEESGDLANLIASWYKYSCLSVGWYRKNPGWVHLGGIWIWNRRGTLLQASLNPPFLFCGLVRPKDLGLCATNPKLKKCFKRSKECHFWNKILPSIFCRSLSGTEGPLRRGKHLLDKTWKCFTNLSNPRSHSSVGKTTVL